MRMPSLGLSRSGARVIFGTLAGAITGTVRIATITGADLDLTPIPSRTVDLVITDSSRDTTPPGEPGAPGSH
jgi:hypothetical protein